MTTETNCVGCGVLLQTTDKKGIGFTPASALERDTVLCQRCFQLKHYNRQAPVAIDNDDFLQMVSSIRDTKSYIIHLIDVFDVDGTLIQSLPRLVGDNPIVLVANKMDLLPKSTNRRKVTHWLFRKAREAGIKVEDVLLISSKKNEGFTFLAEQMDKKRHGKDIYVVGVTNVGKSTFINQFIERATGIKETITTSYYPGTTLGFIDIPLEDGGSLIDTPGIVNQDQIAHYVSDEELKIITPKKEIKARNYQLNVEQTLFVGGFARIDYASGNRQPFVCYFANDLRIHRTKTENADSLYKRQKGDILAPPTMDTLHSLPPLVKYSYRIEAEKTDIVFPGLGWITILDGGASVHVHYPKDIAVSLRQSFL